ncbi:2-keto-4-pentenoate hydratase [Alkalihalobacillus deserti]|uniref:2-keto-4-pentenoate hydratase n=1 Tax=Alkalihalobacillus deserti TaxID=2879466 RepID=UPI001D14B98F|nr:2-keto-4-pentenoate hydratase [Alkalihalobacillus deserti]
MNIQDAASALLEAETTKRPIAPFTSSAEAISVDDAYQIQLEQIRRKVGNGATIVGKKIGLTSKVMQEMFNVSEPDYGHILDDMIYKNGDMVSLDRFIQPKVEFEIAFVLKKDLKGPGVTKDEVIEATDYVVPSIEIIDSRIKDWQFKYEDTVADNGSSAGAIIGRQPSKLSDLDLPTIKMNVFKNGELMDTATGEAVMGNPILAVAWLANALSRYDISLHAGEVILSGALSKAVPIEDGDTFTAEFDHIGNVSATFNKGAR